MVGFAVGARGYTCELEFTRIDTPDAPYEFRSGAQDYTLRTPGGGRNVFTINWSEALHHDLQSLRASGCDPAVVARVGTCLQQALAPAGWTLVADQIARALAAGQAVRITIISNAAELYALPWELLAYDNSGLMLGAHPNVLVRYAWPDTATKSAATAPREGGRILVAWSEAGGPVPDVEHVEAIESACRRGHLEFDRSRDVLTHANLRQLVDKLAAVDARDPPYVVLHILCHGTAIADGFGLLLDDPTGQPTAVDAGRLAQVLAPFAPTIGLVVLAACDSGNQGTPGNRLGSVAQALHRCGLRAVVASRFPLSTDGSTRFVRSFFHNLVVDLCPLEQALAKARIDLAHDPQRLDWASIQLYARPRDGDDTRPLTFRPYRGLLAFEGEHSRFFFGRTRELTEVVDKLAALTAAKRPRFVVVAGASGTGKSSVVLAGVAPRLASEDPKRTIVVLRPGETPMQALDGAVSQRTPDTRHFLLIVDQFEELFTQTPQAATRARFLRRLWSLARGPSGIEVIITIRVDYVGRCGEIPVDREGTRLDRVAYDPAHRVSVAQMSPEQLRATIERPAERVGLRLEAGLTDRILADAGDEPGALPLLEYTLDRLWLARDGQLLTTKVYQELGGVVGALGSKADEILDSCTKGQRDQARRLLTQLVTLGETLDANTRRRRSLAALRPREHPEVFDEVVERLIAARLLVRSDAQKAEPTIEVAHEALIRRWQRLRDWLRDDRDKLADLHKLTVWAAEYRAEGRLLSGSQLGFARDVVDSYPKEIEDSVHAMVRESQARVARIYTGLGAIAAVVLVLGVAAVILWQDARKNALAAQKSEREANASAVAIQRAADNALEEATLARDKTRLSAHRLRISQGNRAGTEFLREVESRAPLRDIHGFTEAAWASLRPPTRLWQLERSGYSNHQVFVSNNGKWLASGWPEGLGYKIEVYDLDNHNLHVSTTTPEEQNLLAVHPDGARVLLGSMQSVELWNLSTDARDILLIAGFDADEPSLLDDPIVTGFFTSEGTHAVVTTSSGSLWSWDTASLTEVGNWPHHRPIGQDFALSNSRPAQWLDLKTGKHRPVTPPPREPDGLSSDDLFPQFGDGSVWALSADHSHVLAPVAMYGSIELWKVGHTAAASSLWNEWLNNEFVNEPIWGLAAGPGGTPVIVEREDVVVLDPSGKELNHYDAPWREMPSTLSRDGIYGLTFKQDSVSVYEMWTGTNLVTFDDVYGAMFRPQHQQLLTISHSTGIELWDLAPAHRHVAWTPPPFQLTWQGSQLVANAGERGLFAYEVESGKETLHLQTNISSERWLAYNLDHQLAIDSMGNLVQLPGETPVASLGSLRSAAIADDGNQLVTLSATTNEVADTRGEPKSFEVMVTVWASDGTRIRQFAADDLVAVTFAREPEFIVGRTKDGSLRLFDGAGKLRSFGSKLVSGVSPALENFSNDLHHLVRKAGAEIYDTEVHEVVASFDEDLTASAFSQDGSRVALAFNNGKVRVWDLVDRYELAVLGHDSTVTAVGFSPDATKLACATGDGRLVTWELGRDVTAYLMQRMWTSPKTCPPVAQRMAILNFDDIEATAEHAHCQRMMECMDNRSEDSDNTQRCLAAFHRGQAKDRSQHALRRDIAVVMEAIDM